MAHMDYHLAKTKEQRFVNKIIMKHYCIPYALRYRAQDWSVGHIVQLLSTFNEGHLRLNNEEEIKQ